MVYVLIFQELPQMKRENRIFILFVYCRDVATLFDGTLMTSVKTSNFRFVKQKRYSVKWVVSYVLSAAMKLIGMFYQLLRIGNTLIVLFLC